MSRTSIDTEQQVCQMYSNRTLIHDIAEAVGVTRHTVVRILKRQGSYVPERSRKHKDQKQSIRNQQIIKLFKQGLSTRQIAKQLKIGKSTAQLIVSEYQKSNIDDSFQERFFQTIDTEKKAYWLGFLMADGCITDRSIRVELTLADQSHLEKFRDVIKYYRTKFYYRNDGIKSVLYIISSKTMINDLATFGCIPRKSLVIRFPSIDLVPTELIHHFMRGYFDGNGCINISERTRSSVSVTSNMEFLDGYQQALNCGISKTTTVKIQQTHSEGMGLFMLGGNQQVLKIYDFLYKDATIFLDRKKEKFDILSSRLR